MNFNVLEQFEEKFYFRTSHLFWHFLTGLGALVLVGGFLILLWGISPTFRPGVKKPKYPKPVQVAAGEVWQKIQPGAVKKKNIPVPSTAVTSKANTGSSRKKQENDPAEAAYMASLGTMKLLLPPAKFAWKSRGHWDESYWQKKWVVTVLGINDRLKTAYKKARADNFSTKKKLLDSYIAFIRPFPVEQRLSVLKSAIQVSKENVAGAVKNVSLLQTTSAHFSIQKVDCIKILATFMKKNPRDGRPFVEYVNAIIPKFNSKIRKNILATLVRSYYRNFNDIGRLKEATNLFLKIQNSFGADVQSRALSAYYGVFLQKNAGRSRQVAQLQRQYQRELQKARMALEQKKAEKAKYRGLGWTVIGGSILFISLAALLLVLLSIQRNIKEIRETTKPKTEAYLS